MTSRPTICILTGTLNAFAGAERMTAVLGNALAEQGYRVFVLSLWDRTSVFSLHASVSHHALFEQRPSFKRAYRSTVLGIRRFVRQHNIDVLIEVDTMLTLFTVPATLGLKVRRIAWEHCHFDEDLGRKTRRAARWLAAHSCQAVVVLTERDRARWITALHPRSTVTCIGNALPFAMPEPPASCSERTVLAVGRLVPVKGFDVLLHAWAHVAPRARGWSLDIVGEGAEREALETLRRTLKLDSVRFLGAHPDIADDYRRASVFCLSSRYEGFGLVLAEAMSFGLPIVSTDCETGPREFLTDRRNALLVPVDAPPVLAEALLALIEDPVLAGRLGRAAREDATRYAPDHIIQQWIALLAAVQRD